MIIIDLYFQLFSVVIFILMLLVLIYYLSKINILNKEINDSKTIIQIIIGELKQRLYNQDQKLLDLDVKLNIIDLRINKFSNQINKSVINKSKDTFNTETITKEISQHQSISQKKSLLTETEKRILDSLSYKKCTANELQFSLNKTREHTSRLLNKLFREGYIIRDDLKKPYVYELLN
tara:strand:- start:2120 stop:2653 length:534 start_codon:yes stop_codon:yes gene_type:complete